MMKNINHASFWIMIRYRIISDHFREFCIVSKRKPRKMASQRPQHNKGGCKVRHKEKKRGIWSGFIVLMSLPGLCEADSIKQMITLTVIPLSSFHCKTIHIQFFFPIVIYGRPVLSLCLKMFWSSHFYVFGHPVLVFRPCLVSQLVCQLMREAI